MNVAELATSVVTNGFATRSRSFPAGVRAVMRKDTRFQKTKVNSRKFGPVSPAHRAGLAAVYGDVRYFRTRKNVAVSATVRRNPSAAPKAAAYGRAFTWTSSTCKSVNATDRFPPPQPGASARA